MCSRSTGLWSTFSPTSSVCTCFLAMAADTHMGEDGGEDAWACAKAMGVEAEANGDPSIGAHPLSQGRRGTGRALGMEPCWSLLSFLLPPAPLSEDDCVIHATYSSISQTQAWPYSNCQSNNTKVKKKKSCSFHAFSTTLRCPTSPLFQGLQAPGKFLFLIVYWNEWSSSRHWSPWVLGMSYIHLCSPCGPGQAPGKTKLYPAKSKAYGQDCSLDGWEQAARLLMLLLSNRGAWTDHGTSSRLVWSTPGSQQRPCGEEVALQSTGYVSDGWWTPKNEWALPMCLLSSFSYLQTPRSITRSIRKYRLGFQRYIL